MKKVLKIKYLFIGLIGVVLIVLGLEGQDSYRKRCKFRTMQDPIASSESVDLRGLRELPLAGGPMMPLFELKDHLAHIKKPILIIDGTLGKSGYVQGIPENYLEYRKKFPSWKSYVWRLWYTKSLKSNPERIISPAKAAKLYGFGYQNFPIGSKYLSKDEDIDKFVAFFDTLPKNVFLYLHCLFGQGRTSMMLVMVDILRNAPTVSLKDIVRRQYLLGSVNLFDTTPWSRLTYTKKTLEDRKNFIERFYEFICQRKAGKIQLWSEWNQEKRKP